MPKRVPFLEAQLAQQPRGMDPGCVIRRLMREPTAAIVAVVESESHHCLM
jgi:hypothetical protein